MPATSLDKPTELTFVALNEIRGQKGRWVPRSGWHSLGSATAFLLWLTSIGQFTNLRPPDGDCCSQYSVLSQRGIFWFNVTNSALKKRKDFLPVYGFLPAVHSQAWLQRQCG